jgi:LAS superfamily LD-carboxypeptidase LdcB
MLDLDGLQVAYLGVALAHYLDLETGDIIDIDLDAPPPGEESRFLRIPTRTPESEGEDRRLFVGKLDDPRMRERLLRLVDDPHGFRSAISEDLRVQRQFFNFKNEQATRAIEEWIAAEGLS